MLFQPIAGMHNKHCNGHGAAYQIDSKNPDKNHIKQARPTEKIFLQGGSVCLEMYCLVVLLMRELYLLSS